MKLRELNRQDLGALNAWRNDREVVDNLGAHFAFVGPEVDEAWFAAYLASRDRNVRLAILDDENEFVGCSYLLNISWVHRSAEFAIMIGRKDRRRQGIGRAASKATLLHAFEDLQLHRVWLNVNHNNIAARKLYEQIGFRHEGTLRDATYKNGRYLDVDTMAVLDADFAAT